MTTDFFANQNFKPVDGENFTVNGKMAFTVDVEEWFQVGAFETSFSRSEWHSLESRAEHQTMELLSLLSDLNITATFFSLGWVAQHSPKAIVEIVDAGHELACHGMDHQRLFTMSRSEFSRDIKQAKDLLEQTASVEVKGYRAPSFSLTPNVWWVYEELEEAGFQYSSSLYPVKTDHYGAKMAPRKPFLPRNNGHLIEIPMTVCDLPLRRIPASGGGYFRLLPYLLSRYMLRKGPQQAGSPGIFYMHPWELDVQQPYVKDAPLLSRFRHYTAQARLPLKLQKLARDFKWGRMDDVFQDFMSDYVRHT